MTVSIIMRRWNNGMCVLFLDFFSILQSFYKMSTPLPFNQEKNKISWLHYWEIFTPHNTVIEYNFLFGGKRVISEKARKREKEREWRKETQRKSPEGSGSDTGRWSPRPGHRRVALSKGSPLVTRSTALLAAPCGQARTRTWEMPADRGRAAREPRVWQWGQKRCFLNMVWWKHMLSRRNETRTCTHASRVRDPGPAARLLWVSGS